MLLLDSCYPICSLLMYTYLHCFAYCVENVKLDKGADFGACTPAGKKKSICCSGGLCGAVALKFCRSGQCTKNFPRCYAAYTKLT